MDGKNTDALKTELKKTADLSRFLEENEANFLISDVIGQLQRMLKEKKISKSQAAKMSGMSEVYLYQILSGRRRPSRSRLICLCIGLGASLEETQRLLRQSGYAELYPRVRADAVMMYGIMHGLDLFAVNDLLFGANEVTLI